MKAPSSRIQRLLLLFGVLLVIALLRPFWGLRYDWFFNERFNSQFIHLGQIEDHIEAIRPRWMAFTNDNPAFQRVQLFAYTADDGLLGAVGSVPTEEDLARLRKFLEDTKPPRSVYLKLLAVDDWFSELGSPANRSQPIRAETNQTSVTAGSDR